MIVEDGLDGQQEFTITDVEGVVGQPKAKLNYYVKDGEVKLTWKLDTDLDEAYMVTFVDAITGEVADAIDWVCYKRSLWNLAASCVG